MKHARLSITLGLITLISSTSLPVAASAQDADQQAAYERVWGFTAGRPRPSRRELKANVREDFVNAASSFEDYKLELRQAQQRETERELRDVKRERVIERVQAEPAVKTRGATTRRVRKILRTAMESDASDVCEGLHLKARLGCLVKVRRDERLRQLEDERMKTDALADESESDDGPVFQSQTSE